MNRVPLFNRVFTVPNLKYPTTKPLEQQKAYLSITDTGTGYNYRTYTITYLARGVWKARTFNNAINARIFYEKYK